MAKKERVVLGDIKDLQDSLDYYFADVSLLETALTHRSLSRLSNERLEFLGDSILGLIISQYLYQNYPNLAEGKLSRIRSNLVDKQSLADIAKKIRLENYIRHGKNLRITEGSKHTSLIANTLEAIIGAMYLDGSWKNCCDKTISLYREKLDAIDENAAYKDPKTHLQEIMQERYGKVPGYEVVSNEGLPHQKHFVVVCRLPNGEIFRGEGSSLKKAEKQAASEALTTL